MVVSLLLLNFTQVYTDQYIISLYTYVFSPVQDNGTNDMFLQMLNLFMRHKDTGTLLKTLGSDLYGTLLSK